MEVSAICTRACLAPTIRLCVATTQHYGVHHLMTVPPTTVHILSGMNQYSVINLVSYLSLSVRMYSTFSFFVLLGPLFQFLNIPPHSLPHKFRVSHSSHFQMQFYGIGLLYLFLLLEISAPWIFRLDVWPPRRLKLQRMVVSLVDSLLSLWAFHSRTWVLSLGKLFSCYNFRNQGPFIKYISHTNLFNFPLHKELTMVLTLFMQHLRQIPATLCLVYQLVLFGYLILLLSCIFSPKKPQLFLAAWCMVGIVTASMSTADGAILAMGTVFAHNICRQIDAWRPDLITAKNLLWVTRAATVPLSIASTCIAAYYTNDNPQGATGYLLIVAFDVMLATSVVPLFACFYVKNPSPTAGLMSVIAGATTRTVLEFVLPKDGYLLLPYDVPEFQDVGPAASSKVPVFVDAPPEDVWDPTVEVCETRQFEDYTGVDSLSALLASFLVFAFFQLIENHLGRPIMVFPGLVPYTKDIKDEDDLDLDKSEATKPVKHEEPEDKEVEMTKEEAVEQPSAEEAEG